MGSSESSEDTHPKITQSRRRLKGKMDLLEYKLVNAMILIFTNAPISRTVYYHKLCCNKHDYEERAIDR